MTWNELSNLESDVYYLTDCVYYLLDCIIKTDEPESLQGALCGLSEVVDLLCSSVVKFDEGYVEFMKECKDKCNLI